MIIPDDIRTKALKLAKLAIFRGGIDWTANDIAEALMAERNAATKAARRRYARRIRTPDNPATQAG